MSRSDLISEFNYEEVWCRVIDNNSWIELSLLAHTLFIYKYQYNLVRTYRKCIIIYTHCHTTVNYSISDYGILLNYIHILLQAKVENVARMCGHEELLSDIRGYKVSEAKTCIMEEIEQTRKSLTLLNALLRNFNEMIETSCQSNERAPAA